jgi:hypothetical protein
LDLTWELEVLGARARNFDLPRIRRWDLGIRGLEEGRGRRLVVARGYLLTWELIDTVSFG